MQVEEDLGFGESGRKPVARLVSHPGRGRSRRPTLRAHYEWE
jgi:hypothetical protein